ncbi:MAG: sporulation integral membrane protein YtvI [Bacillota bacterium]|nr:sporulation integral membrane protein YtvI [Bacillota bacterium]
MAEWLLYFFNDNLGCIIRNVKKANLKWEGKSMTEFTKKLWITLGTLIAIVLILLAVYYVLPHLMPFFVALLFALLLEPLNQRLMTWFKIKRCFAVNITFFLFLGLTIVLSYFVIVKIVTELFNLVRTIHQNIPEIQEWFHHIHTEVQDIIKLLPPELTFQINNAYQNFTDRLAQLDLLTAIGSLTYSISTAIPYFFIITLIFFISLYLISINLIDIQNKFFSYFEPKSKEKLSVVLSELRVATIGFFQAQVILSSITYVMSLIGLFILDVKHAFAIALVVLIVDILPILGVGSALIPWATFSLASGDTFLAVGLVILFVIITVVRRIVEPKVLGDRIGLGTLPTLISIWVGFKLLGVAGVLIGPLLLILIKALIKAGVFPNKIKI